MHCDFKAAAGCISRRQLFLTEKKCFPVNCDARLGENNFQTHIGCGIWYDIGQKTVEGQEHL